MAQSGTLLLSHVSVNTKTQQSLTVRHKALSLKSKLKLEVFTHSNIISVLPQSKTIHLSSIASPTAATQNQVTTLNSLIRGLYMNDSHINRFIHILLESGDDHKLRLFKASLSVYKEALRALTEP